MKRTKIAMISLVLMVCLLSSVLGVVMYQKSITNNMTLNASYDFALYETGTTNPRLSIAWGAFNDSEVKTYVIDLKYLGNVQGAVSWDAPMPSGWTLTLEEKNFDATTYNAWLSGETHQITGLNYGHLKNVRLTLTETTATPLTPYTFTVNFYSLG
jgi:hypothetical protein